MKKTPNGNIAATTHYTGISYRPETLINMNIMPKIRHVRQSVRSEEPKQNQVLREFKGKDSE
jgi:hypothetical protein